MSPPDSAVKKPRKTPDRRPWPTEGEPWSMDDSLRVVNGFARLWGRVPPERRKFVRAAVEELLGQAAEGSAGK